MKQRQAVIALWKSVFTDETTKVGVTDYVNQTTGGLDSRRYYCSLSQCLGLSTGTGNDKNCPLGN